MSPAEDSGTVHSTFSRESALINLRSAVTIPLSLDADFRRVFRPSVVLLSLIGATGLPDNLAEWQFFSPASAVGRNRYRGSKYVLLEEWLAFTCFISVIWAP